MVPARIILAFFFVFTGAAAAQPIQEARALDEGARFVFSTLTFLAGGIGAIIAAAAAALRFAGLSAARHRATVMVQAAAASSIALLLFWSAGANLAFNIEPGGLLGSVLSRARVEDAAPDASPEARLFFFSSLAMFAALIPLGAVAARARFWSYCLFVAAFVGLILPIVVSWVWGGGYLSATWAFSDLAGGAVIHVTGGAAALAACMICGARTSRDRTPTDVSGLPFVGIGSFLTLACFVAIFAGAAGPLQSTEDASIVGRIALNAGLASATACLSALVLTRTVYRKIDAAAVLNALVGAIAALSAAPSSPAQWQAALIGGIAGVIVTLGSPALERLGLDDAAGAVPAHLFCGAWGVLILPWHHEGASMLGQVAGLIMIAAFTFTMCALIFVALRYTIGFHIGHETELSGLDQAHLMVAAHREAGLR